MKPGTSLSVDENEEIPALIQTLLAAERRLVELTSGQVDAIEDGEGRTFLLRRAQEQLRLVEAAKQNAILNALPAHVALLDRDGCIISVNEVWHEFVRANVIQSPGYGVGINYLEVCDLACGKNSSEAGQVAAGIRSVMSGREKSFSIEYPCHSLTEQRWFLLTVTPLSGDLPPGAVIMHLDITDRKLAEMASKRLAAIVESSQDAIIGKDLKSVVISWNVGAEKIFGYTASEMVGTSIIRLIPLERHNERRLISEKIQHNENVEHYEAQRWTKDQRLIDVAITVSPIKDTAGNIVGVAEVARDITERKRTEEALQRRQTELRVLFDLMPAMIWFKDTENGILRVNQHVADAAGKTVEEIEGKPSLEIYPQDAASYYKDDLEVIQAGAPKLGIIERLQDRWGKPLWVQTDKVPVYDKEGKVIGLVVMAQDISNRKNAEEALREKDALIRIAGRVTRTGGWVVEVPSQHVFWSDEIFDILGYPRGEIPSLDEILTLYVEPGREKTRIALETCMRSGTPFDLEVEILTAKKKQIWVRVCGEAGRSADNSVERVQGAFQDISVRKQAELRLQLQAAVTEVLAEAGSMTDINLKILETLGQGLHWELGEMWLVDRANRVLRCAEIWHPPSTEFQEFAAVSRAVFMGIGEGLPGAVWASGRSEWSPDVMRDARFRRRAQTNRLELYGWVGFPIRIRDEVLGVAGFFAIKMPRPDTETLAMLDIIGAQIGIFIERRQLADQFREAQKMEAIGTLAGGIAHDFNNILAAINGYTELCSMVLTGNDEVRDYLDSILKATNRATHLVRQILTFSRQQKLERRAIQLQPILAETLMLLRSTIPSTIEFETSVSPDAPTVLADATQIHQVLMNLGTNAWHAMKDHNGRLKVSLDSYMVDATHAAAQSRLRPGLYARISVSDTGSGMDQATQRRIFEPFFTTKAPGEGTGLGLAVVHGIMDSHEGAITVYSQPGEGTVFRLYFPAHSGEARIAAPQDGDVPRGQGERILFVDDEELLVHLGPKTLAALGYEVESTTQPAEALAMVRADPQRFSLVITDQTMPKMTGLALASQLQQIRPGLPIILSTGYSQSLTAEEVSAAGLRQLLLKPFTMRSLGNAVHAALYSEPGTLKTNDTNSPY